MEGIKEGFFTQALKRGREGLNARFAYARRMNRNLDPSAFMDVLKDFVAPVLEAAGKQLDGDAQKIDPLMQALYDLALELSSQGYLGEESRSSLVNDVWQRLLLAILPFLTHAPVKVVSSFSNAAANLDQNKNVDGGKWIDLVADLSTRCKDVEELLNLGMVLSWRCGMAHYRKTALTVWHRLPTDLMAASLGFVDDGNKVPEEEVMVQALADPWFKPKADFDLAKKKKLAVVGEVGSFRGFEGFFQNPPKVGIANGRIYGWDDQACWSIHGDCFGATMQKFGSKPPKAIGKGDGSVMVGKDGDVSFNGLQNRFEQLESITSHGENGGTLAVTLRASHKVFLIAPVAQGAK